jgi:hypothetical protein
MMKGHLASLAIVALSSVLAYAYVPQTPAPVRSVEDEYERIELLAPDSGRFRVTYDVSVVAPGATAWTDATSDALPLEDVSATDLMTGTPLAFKAAGGRIEVTLARAVPRGGQGRIRIVKTVRSPKYLRTRDEIVFTRTSTIRRCAIVLPKGFELISATLPVQVIQEPDGRIAAGHMSVASFAAPLIVHGRALKNPAVVSAGTAAANEPHAPQPPPDTAPPSPPLDQIRVTERAIQDREIVYFLKAPETHAFSLYHDYTASREGEHQYVNVVRTGSTVSDPSARILDTGEELKTRILTGADIVREKIEISERVDADTHVVLIPFTPVKRGASIRLRISETYTDPARYALVNGQLIWHRSFGRNRNDMVLPNGWYLTTSAVPAVISEEPDGRLRLSFWNPRPDNVDVFVKASRR